MLVSNPFLNRRSKGLESAESLIPEAVIGMSRYIRPLDLDHIVALVHRRLILNSIKASQENNKKNGRDLLIWKTGFSTS